MPSHPIPILWSESQKPHGKPGSAGSVWWRPLPPFWPPVCVRPWTAHFACNDGNGQSHTPLGIGSCSCGPCSPNHGEGPCHQCFAQQECPIFVVGTTPGWTPGPPVGSTTHPDCKRAGGGHPAPAATSLWNKYRSIIDKKQNWYKLWHYMLWMIWMNSCIWTSLQQNPLYKSSLCFTNSWPHSIFNQTLLWPHQCQRRWIESQEISAFSLVGITSKLKT